MAKKPAGAMSVRPPAEREPKRERSNDRGEIAESRSSQPRREGEEEGERELIERRHEWLRQLIAAYPSAAAIAANRARIEAFASQHGALLDRPSPKGVFLLTRRPRLTGRTVRNPRRTVGQVSTCVEITGPVPLAGVFLDLRLDPELSKAISPSTVRVFRYDQRRKDWFLTERSGISRHRTSAWAELHRPGVYGAIGLPNGPAIIEALVALAALLPVFEREGADTAELARLVRDLASIRRASAIRDPFAGAKLTRRGLPVLQLLRGFPGPDVPPWWPLPGWPQPHPDWSLDSLEWPFRFRRKWSSAGPSNITVPQGAAATTAGRVLCLAVHPHDGDIVYAGAANGGVWRTLDGGTTWKASLQDAPSLAVSALAIAASQPHVVYAGTGHAASGLSVFRGAGVYKSTDAGDHWAPTAPIESDAVTSIAVHPLDANVVYVAGNEGVHKTTDGGSSWSRVFYGDASDLVLSPLDPELVFVGSYLWVQRSRNGGASWEIVFNEAPYGVAPWIKLAATTIGARGGLTRSKARLRLIAKIDDSLFRSDDGGDTWTAINVGGTERGDNPAFSSMLAVDPQDADVIVSGKVFKRFSYDGGATWDYLGFIENSWVDYHAAAFSPTDPDVLYIASDGGVFRSRRTNGKFTTFEPRNAGLSIAQFYQLSVSDGGPLRLGGPTQDLGVLTTVGPGDAWLRARGLNEGGWLYIDPNDSRNQYADTWFMGLQRSTDDGQTWAPAHNGFYRIHRALVEDGARWTDVTSRMNDPGVAVLLFGGAIDIPSTVGGALYLGADHRYADFKYTATRLGVGGRIAYEYLVGSTWRPLTVKEQPSGARDLTAPPGSMVTWYRFDFPQDWIPSPFEGNTLWWIRLRVVQPYSTAPALGRCFVMPDFESEVHQLVVRPGDSKNLLSIYRGALYRSRNQGHTWEEAFRAAHEMARVKFSDESANVCYAVTTFGQLFRSDSGGSPQTWIPIATGSALPEYGRASDLVVPADGLLYLGYSYRPSPQYAYLYRSDDGGVTWERADGAGAAAALTQPVLRLVVDPYDSDTVCVLTPVGVWRSTDRGATWKGINEGLPPILISDLTIHRSSSTLYASTMGRGVFKRPLYH